MGPLLLPEVKYWDRISKCLQNNKQFVSLVAFKMLRNWSHNIGKQNTQKNIVILKKEQFLSFFFSELDKLKSFRVECLEQLLPLGNKSFLESVFVLAFPPDQIKQQKKMEKE